MLLQDYMRKTLRHREKKAQLIGYKYWCDIPITHRIGSLQLTGTHGKDLRHYRGERSCLKVYFRLLKAVSEYSPTVYPFSLCIVHTLQLIYGADNKISK